VGDLQDVYDPTNKTGNCQLGSLAPALIYDPFLNPNGVRCDLQDYIASIVGTSPATGFAYRPYGNVGVQCGLTALTTGTITPAQFVDLNAKIGAHDINYVARPGRVAADPTAVANVYRGGATNEATNLAKVAIIDMRPIDVTGIHHQFRAWSTRARIQRATGGIGNHVLWFNSGTENEAHDAMAWLSAVVADKGAGNRVQKILSHRPATLLDRCGTAPGPAVSVLQCTGVVDGSTRMSAGGDLTDDNLNCQLKPLVRASYSVTFSDPQWAQVQATFPAGVCDYSKPGIGQQATVPWQRYIRPDGSVVVGGEAMPAPPAGNDGALAARGF
jgi:hypothetical protein